MVCNPTGQSAGTSTFTLSLAGSVPFLLSVGMVALPGKLSNTATASARLVPVRVTSSDSPFFAPRFAGEVRVGACGAATITGGFGWPRAVRLSPARNTTRNNPAANPANARIQAGRRRDMRDLEEGNAGGGMRR